MTDTRIFQVQHLVGRPVTALNGKRIGRLEEIHVEANGDIYEITEFLLGTGALIDRLGIGGLVGRQARELVARWDQIVFDDAGAMKLACPVSDLKERER